MRTLSYFVRCGLVTLIACAGVVLGGCGESPEVPLVGANRASSLTWGSPAVTDHQIVHDGIVRTYKKYVPNHLPGKRLPIVFALHGGGGSADHLSDSNHPWFEWRALADLDKFIVIYPNGVDNNWHDCRSDTEVDGDADDVGFISALIDELDASHKVDLTRVYATGISNGGLMSYRLAAELSDRIAAIGTVVANEPVDPDGECGPPAHPISAVIMSGDNDATMPWAGGCITALCRGTVLSAFGTRNYWINFNGTGVVPAKHAYNDLNGLDGSRVVRSRYTGGTQGTEVAFFRVIGGGHSTPSLEHPQLLGQQNRDIEGIHEIWKVLRKHTLTS